MIISRGLALSRAALRVVPNKLNHKQMLQLQQLRNGGHWAYRTGVAPVRLNLILAQIVGGFMWWWILWHFWHDFGHIVGEFPYPDPSEWTDEELGIPPDDE